MILQPVAAQTVSELTQCLHAFFSHLDERRYDALVAMFLPQGRWLRQGRWLAGHAAIRAALDARPASMRVRHVISNVLVLPGEGADVRVEAYMTAFRQQGSEGFASLFRLNLVSNVLRQEQGEWKLVEQQLLPEFEFPESETLKTP